MRGGPSHITDEEPEAQKGKICCHMEPSDRALKTALPLNAQAALFLCDIFWQCLLSGELGCGQRKVGKIRAPRIVGSPVGFLLPT